MPMILIIVAIAAVALGGAVYFKSSNEAAVTSEGSTTTEVTADSGIADMLGAAEDAADAMENGLGGNVNNNEPDAASEETSAYADGAYTKTGTYTSPAGSETVTVSITLADDVVASATFTGNATNPGSIANQAKFAAGYSDLVVGKNIDEINLTVVNGSSLTPGGFMDALALVKADAKI